jgi:hypothetical protein
MIDVLYPLGVIQERRPAFKLKIKRVDYAEIIIHLEGENGSYNAFMVVVDRPYEGEVSYQVDFDLTPQDYSYYITMSYKLNNELKTYRTRNFRFSIGRWVGVEEPKTLSKELIYIALVFLILVLLTKRR